MTRWTLPLLLALASPLHAQMPEHAGKAGPSAGSTAGQSWEIDTSRSKLTFSIRHLVSRVRGQFGVWSGVLSIPSDDWSNAAVSVTIRASSINTDDRPRDEHLRSPDFFDVKTYPEITFKSTGIKRDGDSVTVAGNLTMKNVTKPVVLKGKFLGMVPGRKPHMRFQAATTINRLDYGVTYNRLLEGGGTTIGDEVAISIEVTAVQK